MITQDVNLLGDRDGQGVFDPLPPGEILLVEFLRPLGVSINRLARDIAVPPNRISGIVNGTRSIATETALWLAKYFGTTAET